ncbi:uncharacterized protein LY79DRAFT_401122 [Colletotrichum navitas]|uniref:Uncharacterized protein n=1 Tax=Colletotrichum navitas TaxID=681940 RepID=A0AAD8UYE3_9PEZI|nr:uncharacterized protein LY79DRAFT_401122 [Colletotrichum navitas]KAK1573686.1 hypothetical protein LY79DRAFT_401122 [Colletotrichum navitas]
MPTGEHAAAALTSQQSHLELTWRNLSDLQAERTDGFASGGDASMIEICGISPSLVVNEYKRTWCCLLRSSGSVANLAYRSRPAGHSVQSLSPLPTTPDPVTRALVKALHRRCCIVASTPAKERVACGACMAQTERGSLDAVDEYARILLVHSSLWCFRWRGAGRWVRRHVGEHPHTHTQRRDDGARVSGRCGWTYGLDDLMTW